MTIGDGPGIDSVFEPDPPEKVKLYQVVILFFYHVVLAIVLAYTLYNVWPPQPWPGDKLRAVDNRSQQESPSNTNTAAANNQPANAKANVNANGKSGLTNTKSANPNGTSATNNSNSNTNTNEAANNDRSASGKNSNSASGSTSVNEGNEPYEGKLPPAFKLFGLWFQPTLETRLILLVMLAGA